RDQRAAAGQVVRRHRPSAAGDPYFLYAASNLGSMVALVAYPVLVEPHLTLPAQGLAWTVGYGLLVLAVAVCAALLWRTHQEETPAADKDELGAQPSEQLSTGRRLRWIVLAFVPSSLMLGVTTYVSTDIAAIPLFWVVPLALYLLSF